MAIYDESQNGNTEGASAAPKPRKARAKAGRDGEATIGVDVGKVGSSAQGKNTKASGSKGTATKSHIVLKLLRTAKGSTIDAIMQATGWQAHSVRGFLSAMVRTKLKLNLTSDVGKDGQRRYRIDDSGTAG